MSDRSRRVALLVTLLVALLGAQTLALLHRVVHGGQTSAVTGHAVAAGEKNADDGGWRGLFPGHDQAGSCDLYDGLTHVQALWQLPALVLPATVSSAPLPVHRSWHLAAQSAGYLARGPPARV